jgi:hypothetical protein
METVRIRDGKKSDLGSGINIPDPQHWKDTESDPLVPLTNSPKTYGSYGSGTATLRILFTST